MSHSSSSTYSPFLFPSRAFDPRSLVPRSSSCLSPIFIFSTSRLYPLLPSFNLVLSLPSSTARSPFSSIILLRFSMKVYSFQPVPRLTFPCPAVGGRTRSATWREIRHVVLMASILEQRTPWVPEPPCRSVVILVIVILLRIPRCCVGSALQLPRATATLQTHR